MAAGTCWVLLSAPSLFPEAAAASGNFATTLAFTTFVFYQVFNLLNVRSETSSVFSFQTLYAGVAPHENENQAITFSGTAQELAGRYLAGETDAVYLVYNEFKSAISQTVVVEQLLPIVPAGGQRDDAARPTLRHSRSLASHVGGLALATGPSQAPVIERQPDIGLP